MENHEAPFLLFRQLLPDVSVQPIKIGGKVRIASLKLGSIGRTQFDKRITNLRRLLFDERRFRPDMRVETTAGFPISPDRLQGNSLPRVDDLETRGGTLNLRQLFLFKLDADPEKGHRTGRRIHLLRC